MFNERRKILVERMREKVIYYKIKTLPFNNEGVRREGGEEQHTFIIGDLNYKRYTTGH